MGVRGRSAVTLLVLAGTVWPAGIADAQIITLPCGGLLTPPCPAPPPPPEPEPPAGQATLTLTPTSAVRRVAEFPKHIKFQGTVTGVESTLGMFVELDMRVPGYGAKGVLARPREQVAADGTFTFSVAAKIGLRVRAVLYPVPGRPAFGESPTRSVTVRSRRSLTVRAISRTRGRFALTSVGPGSVPLASGDVFPRPGAGRRAYLYAKLPGERRVRRVSAGPIRAGGLANGLFRRSAIGSFRITARLRRARFYACSRGSFFRAIEDDATFKDCGKARLPL